MSACDYPGPLISPVPCTESFSAQGQIQIQPENSQFVLNFSFQFTYKKDSIKIVEHIGPAFFTDTLGIANRILTLNQQTTTPCIASRREI